MNNHIYLWKLALKGDQRSYQQIVEIYFDQLFYYGLKFSKDRELIKDVIQEVLINIWERRENISDEVNVKAYLLSSFRRALHRKIKPDIHIVDIQDYHYGFDFNATIDNDIIVTEEARRRLELIKNILNSLSPRQKEIIYLRFFANMSREEIAQTLAIAPQTVSNIIQIALKNLRTYFPEQRLKHFG
ncbi:MAG TPA: sigma-70 family RNA polymerase sigma factor [Niabella sp.]|nr:sigma-70 family RNA polymerase sigma factor [Niabella sp.]